LLLYNKDIYIYIKAIIYNHKYHIIEVIISVYKIDISIVKLYFHTNSNSLVNITNKYIILRTITNHNIYI